MNALVRIEADRVVADSRVVAADFGKRHDHVLRAIDEMVKIQPDLAPNFGAKIYQIETGKGARRAARCFDLDRKGFMLLVMGFNGAKALEVKSRWIDAFDRMEQQLQRSLEASNDDGGEEMEAGLPAMPPLPDDFRERLRFVSEARLIGGKEAGQRAWRIMALPDVFAPQVLVGVAGGAFPRKALSEHLQNSGVMEWAQKRLIALQGNRQRLGEFYADFDDWHRNTHGFGAPISLVSFGHAVRKIGLSAVRSNGSYLLNVALAN